MLDPDTARASADPAPFARRNRRAAAPPCFTCLRHDAGDGTVRVVACGELGMATASSLDQALRDAHPRAPQITLALRGLTFMDCSSLSLLVAAADRARASAGRFLVVRGPPLVDRPGIDRRLDIAR